jgi:hypothetical protein
MKSILGEKYELQIITGNVVSGTNDSFTLATDEGQTYGVSTTNNFSVDFSQRITVAWSKERESIVEPKLIFLYNHDTKNKQYTLPLDLQENRLKLSIKSSVRSLLHFFLILIIGNLLYINLIGFPINLIFSSGCPAVVSSIINQMFALLFSIALVVFFVGKSIKSYQQSNETHFWIIKTLDDYIGESKPAEKQNFQKFRSRILSRYWRLIKWCLYFAKEVLEYSGKTAQEQINLVIASNSLLTTMLLGMLQLMVVIMVLSIALSPLALVLFPVWLPILIIAKLPDLINSLGQYLSVCFPQ